MRRLGVGLAMVTWAVVASAQQQPSMITRLDGSQMQAAAIDARVSQLMRDGRVTGVGLAVFHGGKVVYLKAAGLRDVEKNLPLTPDTVMSAASLTKAAFATVVMRLVERGVLNLDKPIAQYLPKPLPEYPKYEDLRGDERYRQFTLRMLLNHTSGFANWRRFEEDRKLSIHFTPGTRYAYSGEGIDLAQFVVETVTGKSLTVLMDEELYRVVPMTRTSMVWQARFENDFANGYDENGALLGPQRRSRPDAAGSMQTTLRDYAALLSGIMSGSLLSSRSLDQMLATQVRIHSRRQFPSLNIETTSENDAIKLGYGVGWGRYSSRYGEAFFKEGHDDGWRHLALGFRSGSGILILTNSSNGEGIFKPLIDAVLGPTGFPFEWEDYTPYTSLPAAPAAGKE